MPSFQKQFDIFLSEKPVVHKVADQENHSKDNLDTGVLTARQWESLERFAAIKARVNVAVGIRDKYYFVPWQIFKDAKRIYGHKYLSQEDLEPYEVEDRGWAVLFLDYISPLRAYYAYKEAIERS